MSAEYDRIIESVSRDFFNRNFLKKMMPELIRMSVEDAFEKAYDDWAIFSRDSYINEIFTLAYHEYKSEPHSCTKSTQTHITTISTQAPGYQSAINIQPSQTDYSHNSLRSHVPGKSRQTYYGHRHNDPNMSDSCYLSMSQKHGI